MRVFHATPNWNLHSIAESGLLLPPKTPRRIWFTVSRRAMRKWLPHVARHQRCHIQDMRVIALEVPKSDLRLFTGKMAKIAVTYFAVPSCKIIRIYA